MINDLNSELKIITSIQKAIELYPFIHSRDEIRNQFLSDARIQFHEPTIQNAEITFKERTPIRHWFVLFSEEEKRVIDIDGWLVGVEYSTTIEQAKKRIHIMFINLESQQNKKGITQAYQYHSEYFNSANKALKLLSDKDTIHLQFLFPDLPNVELLTKTNYVDVKKESILDESK